MTAELENSEKRPLSPRIFGILNIVLGLFGLVISISISAMAARLTDKTVGITVAVIALSAALPMVTGGIGLLMYRKTGRILSLAGSYIALAAGILYMGIALTALIYIREMLSNEQIIKFITRMTTVLCICIYPAVNIYFMHSRKVRASLK